jgi:hypothetical protein
MGHNLTIIVVQNLFFIGLDGIDLDVIHLFELFKHQCYAHCLNIDVVCLYMLFTHKSHGHNFCI